MSNLDSRPNYQRVMTVANRFFEQTGIPRTPRTEGEKGVDVEKGAHILGANVRRSNLEGEVSGFLFLAKDQQPIIGVNSSHSSYRQRFTIAHELGHLLLHAPRGKNASFVDKSFFIINRDTKSSQGIITPEIEANFFAAEVLMPGELLYRDLANYPNAVQSELLYAELAERYGVSQEAMRFRLSNLGFIQLGH